MIVDTCSHIWSSPDQLGPELARRLRITQSERWGQFDASGPAHAEAMTCVDVSLVFGFRSNLLGARVPNELVADFAAKAPGRRLAVAGIDPMADDALDQVEIADQLGMVALSVSPAAQGFHPAHSAAMQVYDRCGELSMPLFVTTPNPLTRSAQLEFGRPALWDEVARSYPDLPIVIGGLGHPWTEETLALIGKHENVFADIAGIASRPWQLYNALLLAANVGVMDRLLFASAFPRELPAKAIENLYSINGFSHGSQLPSVPRSQVRGIVERDSLELLGIDADVSDAKSQSAAQTGSLEAARRAEPARQGRID